MKESPGQLSKCPSKDNAFHCTTQPVSVPPTRVDHSIHCFVMEWHLSHNNNGVYEACKLGMQPLSDKF